MYQPEPQSVAYPALISDIEKGLIEIPQFQRLNKRKIKARAPSDYMADFKTKNKNLAQTMQTHLIDIETLGVWNDDFETFFRKRCERISQELGPRIISRPGEEHQQRVELNDLEEVEV